VADKREVERIQVLVSREEVTAIDNFRFARQLPSRAAAIRELLRLGRAVRLANDEN
jgi:hypothetical protein